MYSETRQILEYGYLINKGILKNFNEFKSEKKEDILYSLDCSEYQELQEKYKLKSIAGLGDNFTRAKRLLKHLTPRMIHKSNYDNHITCNALALLEYCYEKPENGINCLNKSKIFAECCLALGIPARRIRIMPFAPYDCDNHVVSEIYDYKLNKWIMMDPTTGKYFINKEWHPLSMLEIREHFAENKFITAIAVNSRCKDIEKVYKDNLFDNWYICKNSFYFEVEKYQRFGADNNKWLSFAPEGFSIKKSEINNNEYRIKEYGEIYPELKELFEKKLEKAKNNPEPIATDIEALVSEPTIVQK